MKNIQKTIYEQRSLNNYTENMVINVSDKRINLMRRYLDALLENRKNKLKILDVGCADGVIFKDYTPKADFYGIDIAEPLLKKAQKNGYKTFLLDIEQQKLPFKNEFFDVIIAGEMIEHVVNTDWFMCEINRVLKKNGYLIISIPNINQWISLFMMIFFDLPPRYSARFRAPHVRDFTFKTMKGCLKEFGFEIKKRSGTGIFLPFINKNIFVFLTNLFPRLGSEVVFLCKKINNVVYDEKKIFKF